VSVVPSCRRAGAKRHRDQRRLRDKLLSGARSWIGMRYSFKDRNRSAFQITETELSVIAALAQMGLIRMPLKG
jgi:hypothetical protein